MIEARLAALLTGELSPQRVRLAIHARRPAKPEWLSMRLALIEGDPGHRAFAHFNVSENAAWFTVSDGLPHYPGDSATWTGCQASSPRG
jgi:hypothetical protein